MSEKPSASAQPQRSLASVPSPPHRPSASPPWASTAPSESESTLFSLSSCFQPCGDASSNQLLRHLPSLVPRPSSLVPRPSSLVPRPSSLVPRPSSLVPSHSPLAFHHSASKFNSEFNRSLNCLFTRKDCSHNSGVILKTTSQHDILIPVLS